MAESSKHRVMEIRAGLSHALGAAQIALERAFDVREAAEARYRRMVAAATARRRKLAAARDERIHEIDSWHDTELAALAGAAAGAADRAAPGAAGEPWHSWEPTPLERAAELRIGRLMLPEAPLPAPARAERGSHHGGEHGGQRGGDAGGGSDAGRGEDDWRGGAWAGAPGEVTQAWAGPDSEPPESAAGPVVDEAPPEVPALVRLLDHGHIVIEGDRRPGDDVLAGLLLRALGTSVPGQVQIIGYDPENLGGGLAGFAPLATAGVLTFVGPGDLDKLLDELVGHVRRINETVLAGEYSSVRELHAATRRRPEPWRVAVLLGGGEPSRHQRTQLDRLLRTGAACGVHLVIRGQSVEPGPGIEFVVAAPGDDARIESAGDLPVRLDPSPTPSVVTATCRQIAEAVAAGPAPVALDSLLPEAGAEWRESSATGLTAPLGDSPQGPRVQVTLSDYPPHALIAGPSGTGKTNFLYAWMGALSARYSPDELAFYLLDFKEGVSFARFAPGRRDPSWLPHVRLVGVNVNTDREFGLALLRFLGGELKRRADAAKQHEVTSLAELRAEDPEGAWPRIVAVVDEFQVLLAGRDAVTTEAVELLEDLARRGRSQGIHLVLASQDVSGIEALWGRPALVAQFSLRIALPKARRVLAETNPAADTLPRYHAVVNADSGAPEANRIVRVPAAGDREQWSSFQHRLWRRRPAELGPPRLFDGDVVPRLADSPDYRELRVGESTTAPVMLLGQTIDVAARSAQTVLRRAPGRNLAVLGTRTDEACAILATAGRSLAAQFTPAGARFSVVCLDTDARAAAEALHARIPGSGFYLPDDVYWLLEDAAAEATASWPADRPHFIMIYAADALPGGKEAADQLRTVLRQGPERRLHVLGWWRGAGLLRDSLGGHASRTDPIGAWVALDVHGSELSPYYPGQGAPNWYPRPWRALHFDRSVHRGAEVIIPLRNLMSELQPADFERADYRTVLRRLTSLDAKAAGLREEARRWYSDRLAAADVAVQEAAGRLEAAERSVRAAQRGLEEVDARAAGLWSDFVHRIGPVAERFGRTLPPASIPRQRGDDAPDRDAEDYLKEVENRVRYTPPARPITLGTKILFGMLGFAGGLLGVIANLMVRRTGAAAGGDWQQAAPVVALLVMLLFPVLAVVTAKLIADRRDAPLDTSAVVTVLATGLVTAGLLFAAVLVAQPR